MFILMAKQRGSACWVEFACGGDKAYLLERFHQEKTSDIYEEIMVVTRNAHKTFRDPLEPINAN